MGKIAEKSELTIKVLLAMSAERYISPLEPSIIITNRKKVIHTEQSSLNIIICQKNYKELINEELVIPDTDANL